MGADIAAVWVKCIVFCMGLTELSLEDYLALELGNGETVVERDGVYWRAVRPFFYQPLMMFSEYPAGSISGPGSSWMGGWQHAVPLGGESNSFIQLLMFENAQAYSLETTVGKRRRERLQSALAHFKVRRIESADQFVREAHPVYHDFFQRTGYQCIRDRSSVDGFRHWAERLFKSGNIYVYGAYSALGLDAVSVFFRHQNTLVFAALFSSTRSLEHWVSDLMIHHARETAASDRQIQQVFAGRYRGGGGVDQFYLLRGATVVSKPAFLKINSVADHLIAFVNPSAHRRLWGVDGLESVAMSSRGLCQA